MKPKQCQEADAYFGEMVEYGEGDCLRAAKFQYNLDLHTLILQGSGWLHTTAISRVNEKKLDPLVLKKYGITQEEYDVMISKDVDIRFDEQITMATERFSDIANAQRFIKTMQGAIVEAMRGPERVEEIERASLGMEEDDDLVLEHSASSPVPILRRNNNRKSEFDEDDDDDDDVLRDMEKENAFQIPRTPSQRTLSLTPLSERSQNSFSELVNFQSRLQLEHHGDDYFERRHPGGEEPIAYLLQCIQDGTIQRFANQMSSHWNSNTNSGYASNRNTNSASGSKRNRFEIAEGDNSESEAPPKKTRKKSKRKSSKKSKSKKKSNSQNLSEEELEKQKQEWLAQTKTVKGHYGTLLDKEVTYYPNIGKNDPIKEGQIIKVAEYWFLEAAHDAETSLQAKYKCFYEGCKARIGRNSAQGHGYWHGKRKELGKKEWHRTFASRVLCEACDNFVTNKESMKKHRNPKKGGKVKCKNAKFYQIIQAKGAGPDWWTTRYRTEFSKNPLSAYSRERYDADNPHIALPLQADADSSEEEDDDDDDNEQEEEPNDENENEDEEEEDDIDMEGGN